MSEGKAKFTKGPWDFSKGYRFYHCTSSRPNRTGFYFEIGENAGSNSCSFDEEWMANAKLAEAATDMYAVINELLENDAVMIFTGAIEADSRFDLEEWGRRAASALAKARGEAV